MPAISTYRLPEVLAKGAEFGPSFPMNVQTSVSGLEQRVRTWEKCRGRGDVAIGLRNITNVTDQLNYIRQVNAMFLAHGGFFIPFRFLDPFDNTATDENFGTGDSADTTFQLTKTYDPLKLITGSPGSLTYVRNIMLLNGTPTIKVNGVTKTVVTDYTISNVGLVTFTSPPTTGHAITWTGGFELPVRWDMEMLPIRMGSGRHAEISSMPIIEVLGAAEITG